MANQTIAITASNISTYFAVSNGNYSFVGSGSTFTSNNGGKASSTAQTTLTAKQNMTVSFTYSYSSESNYDKFTLTVGGTTVENAVSGATTTKTYSKALTSGQTIVFTYTKDGSVNSNDDKCTFSNMQVTIASAGGGSGGSSNAHKTLIGGTAYSISGGRTLVGGTGYSVEKGRTLVGGTGYDVSFSNLPPIGTALNDCTWEQISAIAASGLAKSYFALGDVKSVPLNGKIGSTTVNATYYAYIIGFDHAGATNTITFGTFKNANGVSIAIDADVGMESSLSAKSYGGWKASYMRYAILGSTDVKPTGSSGNSNHTGYDPSATCATNPVANTFMAALPAELRAVMKPITLYYVRPYDGDAYTAIDYLPLLALTEFYSFSVNNGETVELFPQYAYYAQSSSSDLRVKYSHSYPTSTVRYWTRSEYSTSYGYVIKDDGSSAVPGWGSGEAIAPIFRV